MLESHMTTLLKPISAQSPSGALMRYTPAYDAIQEACIQEDGTKLPEGVWQAESKHADWKKVSDLCVKMLTSQSKDLQVMMWLIEALFFLEGFPGLNQGLEVLQGLSKKFWETLYPLPEEGDLEARFVPYEWLDYQIPQDILTALITQPAHKELPSYTLVDWIDGSHLDLLSRKQKDPEAFLTQEGRPLLTDILASVKKTPQVFYETLEIQIKSTRTLLQAIEKIVSEKTKQEISFFFRLKGQLDTLLTYLTSWKNQCFRSTKLQLDTTLEGNSKKASEGESVSQEEKTDGSGDVEGPQSTSHLLPSGSSSSEMLPLTSRKEAYDLLARITDFLLSQDPHSPTPYLLRQTLQWQDKSLPDVYADFAGDPQALLFLMRLLGVKG